MTHLISCMGGWCSKRDKCKLYEPRPQCVDRLCEAGQYDSFEPAHVVRPASDWIALGLPRAAWFAPVTASS